MIATLAFLLVGFPQAQSAPKLIEYTTVAVPMRVALAEIGKQAGVKLIVSEELREEPIILRLKSVPAKDVIAKIAEVVSAQWQTLDDGSRLLERTAVLRDKLIEEQYLAAAQDFKVLLAHHRNVADSLGSLESVKAEEFTRELASLAAIPIEGRPSTAMLARREALRQKLPESRLFSRLMSIMEPEELAALPSTKRVVFSSDPTPMQRPLPESVKELIDSYVSERSTLSVAMKRQAFPPSMNGWDVLEKEIREPLRVPPRTVLLSMERWPVRAAISCYLALYDDAGLSMNRAEQRILSAAFNQPFQDRLDRENLAKKASETEAELGDVSKEIIRRALYGRGQPPTAPLAPEARVMLLRPTVYDPLSFATSEVAIGIATKRGLNAIIYSPDSIGEFILSRQSKITLEIWQNLLKRPGDFTVEAKDGWLIGKPLDPLVAVRKRIHRGALERYLLSVTEKGYSTLDDTAEIWTVDNQGDAFSGTWLRCLTGSANLEPSYSPEAMRIYSALSPKQRDAAKAGDVAIQLRDMSDEQVEAIHSLVFDRVSELRKSGVRDPRLYDPLSSHIGTETTVALPNGLPQGTVLKIRDKIQEVYFCKFADGTESAPSDHPMSLEHIAAHMAQLQRLDLFPFMANSSLGTIRRGTERKILLHIRLGDQYETDLTMEEKVVREETAVEASKFLSTLSDDDRRLVETQISKLLARWKDTKPGALGGTQEGAPPPPP